MINKTVKNSIPIKKILLEALSNHSGAKNPLSNVGFSGPMSASKKYSLSDTNRPRNPSNIGAVINSKTEATKQQEPLNSIGSDKIKIETRERTKAIAKEQAKAMSQG